jgi:hypothetical protein
MLKLLVALAAISLLSPSTSSAQFFEEGNFVRDVRNNVIWYRCTLGKVWDYNTDTCTGETVRLNQEELLIAIKQAEQQLGGSWRLPTRNELETLVCDKCDPPKIREKYIEREAYWTGTKNRFHSKMFWSVNFMTGNSYSRFFEYQQLPALLVQDR